MPSKLVIVESPAKAKTLSKYLGKNYIIKASMGHIRDLPSKNLAVDVDNNFKPDYQVIPGKSKTVKDLQKAAKTASEIILATDPDREGEAIAWHIAHLLKQDDNSAKRVQFNEITKQAVQDAMKNPGIIDMKKVDAQQARRVLDRLVGYLVSGELWTVIARGLSAGRVQSVALRLIVEREALVLAFVPEEYWIISALAKYDNTEPFKVKLVKLGGEEAKVDNGKQAEQIVSDLKSLPSSLHELKHRKSSQKPSAPFTTSTLQQEASRRLRFSVKRTMTVAQQLYEGQEIGQDGHVGLITYMRTDSTRISPVAIDLAREFITGKYGEEYLSPKVRVFGKKKSAQDAHEAIRPTSLEYPPDKVKPYLKPQHYRLYELIWNRFVATQMADARYEGVTIDIGVGEKGEAPAGSEKGKKGVPPYLLRATGRKLLFPGFRKLWGEQSAEDTDTTKKEDGDSPIEVPDVFFNSGQSGHKVIQSGEQINLQDVDGEQKFTQPPARYSESALVKALDELGIGRPSTYAQIITTLQDRKYVLNEERKLKPTDLGTAVCELLVKEFDEVFNVEYTAKMEKALDKVEDGSSWTDTVQEFWVPFKKHIDRFHAKKGELKKEAQKRTGRTCPQCNEGELIERWGRYGKFISCERYPECK
ncbi:type I DNA topoisomerase, partial [bacterium]|nr:type I DNA topoisomerase [bacterium]